MARADKFVKGKEISVTTGANATKFAKWVTTTARQSYVRTPINRDTELYSPYKDGFGGLEDHACLTVTTRTTRWNRSLSRRISRSHLSPHFYLIFPRVHSNLLILFFCHNFFALSRILLPCFRPTFSSARSAFFRDPPRVSLFPN